MNQSLISVSTRPTFFPPTSNRIFSAQLEPQILDVSINFSASGICSPPGWIAAPNCFSHFWRWVGGFARYERYFWIFVQAGRSRVSALGLSSRGRKEAGSDMSLMRRLFMASAAPGFTLNASQSSSIQVHRVTREPWLLPTSDFTYLGESAN